MLDSVRKEALEEFVVQNLDIEDLLVASPNCVKNAVGAWTCPFHTDEVASLFFDKKRQIWKCHSCGRGGGFIQFFRCRNSPKISEDKLISYGAASDLLISKYKLGDELGFSSIQINMRDEEYVPNPNRKKYDKPKRLILEPNIKASPEQYLEYLIKCQDSIEDVSALDKIVMDLDR